MMKSLLEKNKEFILFLNNLSKAERQKILSTVCGKYINTIAEIFQNFLKLQLTRDPNIIRKVKSYKKEIKFISQKKSPIYQKKKILQSKKGGAILSILLPLAASVITSLIGSRR